MYQFRLLEIMLRTRKRDFKKYRASCSLDVSSPNPIRRV